MFCIHLVYPSECGSLAVGRNWNSLECDVVDDRICSDRGTEEVGVLKSTPLTGSRVGLSAVSWAVLTTAPRVCQYTLSFAPDPTDIRTLLEAAWEIGWLLHTVNEGLTADGLFHQACYKGWPLHHLQNA